MGAASPENMRDNWCMKAKDIEILEHAVIYIVTNIGGGGANFKLSAPI